MTKSATRRKTVALLAGAELTRGGVLDSQADEVWTMNWFYLYDWVPRIDRLFEMHPIWITGTIDKLEYGKPRDHWTWLQENDPPYPVYMLTDLPQVAACVRYPLEDVSRCLFGDLLVRGDTPHDFYSSSFDYMIALAIFEHVQHGWWDTIELYGAEMGSDTEYRYQREGAGFFIGQAIARGIKVIRPRKSILLRNKKYGYEGGQMIFRQDLERLLRHWAKEKRDLFAKIASQEGQLQLLSNNGQNAENEDPAFMALSKMYQETRDLAAVAAGHVDCLNYLIKEIDMEERDLELLSPFTQITR